MNKDTMPVVQADRDEAADVWRDFVARPGECIVENNLRNGSMDEVSDLVQAFARHRIATETKSAETIRDLVDALVDDPNWIAAGVPDEAIEAGEQAWEKARHDLENYVSGETSDWDEGMIVAAIFKAVGRTILSRQTGERT
jgi:hypothetical protein